MQPVVGDSVADLLTLRAAPLPGIVSGEGLQDPASQMSKVVSWGCVWL